MTPEMIRLATAALTEQALPQQIRLLQGGSTQMLFFADTYNYEIAVQRRIADADGWTPVLLTLRAAAWGRVLIEAEARPARVVDGHRVVLEFRSVHPTPDAPVPVYREEWGYVMELDEVRAYAERREAARPPLDDLLALLRTGE
jgi:hypothetical protein